jgi:TRAP-type mannitol/chloroaromatic compound transport system permease small subunit
MLNKAASAIEQLVDFSGRAVSWLTLFMVIITFAVVVLRYIFDIGWIALQESITYLHALVFLVGAAYAMQHEAHVRVDIFYTRFSQQTRAWIDLCGALFMLLPFMFFLCWVSWEYVIDSWDVMEGSREAGGLPGVYLLKSLILLMAGLLSLQAVSQIIRALQKIMGED